MVGPLVRQLLHFATPLSVAEPPLQTFFCRPALPLFALCKPFLSNPTILANSLPCRPAVPLAALCKPCLWQIHPLHANPNPCNLPSFFCRPAVLLVALCKPPSYANLYPCKLPFFLCAPAVLLVALCKAPSYVDPTLANLFFGRPAVLLVALYQPPSCANPTLANPLPSFAGVLCHLLHSANPVLCELDPCKTPLLFASLLCFLLNCAKPHLTRTLPCKLLSFFCRPAVPSPALCKPCLLCHLLPYANPCRRSAYQGIMVLLASKFPKVRRHAAEQLYLALLALEPHETGGPDEGISAEAAEAAQEVLVSTAWDEDIGVVKAARDGIAAHLQVPLPAMRAPAGSQARSKNDGAKDEYASYASLLTDFARGGEF
ncbi:hypothetical protein DUNSADRAFT_9764 [Dunaliella salina]|uniref:Uncharacterized protein n=1 Tax=Dunaliella salina TaxID=3046 RepID=A0ABQ7GGU9_DUNSA|nr:hypothetical protein DUNSADRAFT_9764 [Dunaliella salina]|eukprot:KAF5833817.1 hypothetical protein DUNSADRAFT_9764 [Dunaliella salina]